VKPVLKNLFYNTFLTIPYTTPRTIKVVIKPKSRISVAEKLVLSPSRVTIWDPIIGSITTAKRTYTNTSISEPVLFTLDIFQNFT